jgi:regulator of sirC expression with transglutaminase-like and TPR domain
MSAAVSREKKPSLAERQKTALISLLADEDPAVYQTIRSTILSYGQEALLWLRPYILDRDPVLRRRAQEIVQHLARQDSDHHMLAFCLNQGEELDVEQGAWLLAQTQYPDINVAAYQALLDSYAGELRERLAGQVGTEKILAILTQYLFTELGFSGNEQNYYDPDNSYLNRVVDRRLGNPISLCLSYLVIARRLSLPVVGIGMPGHFLCRYQSSTGEAYIDAFNHGRLLTKAECIKYLMQSGHGYLEGYLAPVSPRRMLLRMCANLHQIYVDLELSKESARLQRYIVALSR